VLAWTRGQDFLTDGSMIEEQMPTLVRFTPIECAAGREFNPHGLCFFLSWLLCAAFFFLGAVGSERPVLTKRRSASAPGIRVTKTDSAKTGGIGSVRISKPSNLLFTVSKFQKKDKSQQKNM
jgi:hypothetical protein